MKKYLPTLGAAVLSVCLLLAGMAIGTHLDGAPAGEAPEAKESGQTEDESGVGPVGSTGIPGYDTITFQAGQRTQYVPLENPAGNDCYFIITILLPDGTEIYKSGMIAPGTTLDQLRLEKVPQVGVYENSILRYSCWSMDASGEPVELNGANTFFTLEVKP